MSGKKTKEYKWYFNRIIEAVNNETDEDEARMNATIAGQVSFKTVMRIVNRFKRDFPDAFHLLEEERANARNAG
jgi:hypothetical protein